MAGYTFTIDIAASATSPTTCVSYSEGVTSAAEAYQVAYNWIVPSVVKNGTVNYFLYKQNLNYKATDKTGMTSSGQASVLTGADGDVMCSIRPLWWKVMSKTSSAMTIRIAEEEFDGAVSAHKFDGTIREWLHVGMFHSTQQACTSIYSTSARPAANITHDNFRNSTEARGSTYGMMTYLTWSMLDTIWTFASGSIDGQTTIGQDFTNGNSEAAPVSTAAMLTANGYTESTKADGKKSLMYLFIANPWGSVFDWVAGLKVDGATTGVVTDQKDAREVSVDAAIPSSWATFTSPSVNGYFKDIVNNNAAPFFPKTGGGSSTTYFCDYGYSFNGSGKRCGRVGGSWGDGAYAGPFNACAAYSSSSAHADVGARLQVLDTKTYSPTPTGIHIPVKVGTAWKDSVPRVKVNNAWKTVVGIWAKVNDTWKVVGQASPTPKKYTISWGSGSANSTSKNISWADDAAGMTEAQRNELIKDHCHFAVVKWDGSKPVVNYYLYRDNLNYKATDETCKVSSGVSSVLTGADGDVMLLYDKVWWKVTQTGTVGTNSTVTISFTFEQPTEDGWVSPHTYGDNTSSTSIAQYVGQGVFPAYNSSSQMRSINTSSEPTGNTSQNNFYNAAIYGRNWQYNNKLPMTYAWYIIQLYFVKGNRDCQTAYGNGIVSGSYGATNKDWSATSPWINGTTATQTTGVTALGVHNPWGQKCEFMGEMRNNGGTVKFSVLGGKDHYNIESGTASTWKSLSMYTTGSWRCVAEISGTCQEYPFMATSVSGTDYSKFYADGAYGGSSSGRVVVVGGRYDDGLHCGPLYVSANGAASYSYSSYGARLHVIITE